MRTIPLFGNCVDLTLRMEVNMRKPLYWIVLCIMVMCMVMPALAIDSEEASLEDL